ncbi:MAG: PKD domain-containing protein [Candidatus Sulfotelmatobacter sp.]
MIRRTVCASRRPKELVGKIRLVQIAWVLIVCVLILVEGGFGSSDPSKAPQAVVAVEGLSVVVQPGDGTYDVRTGSGGHSIFHAKVAAEIDHKWVKSTDYPKHEIAQADFEDALGHGRKITVTSSGLPKLPDLAYTLAIYEGRSFGVIEAEVQNHTGNPVTIQSIRSVEADGSKIIDLGGVQSADRVLSDSFSEDWPPLQIYDLGKAPQGMHRAVGSQLIYNRESKESLFLGALTSNRFLTIIHLQTQSSSPNAPHIVSYTVDSTGTTEIQATDPESGLREGPAENLIELSVPLSAGESLSSERVMFSAGTDYHSQLENYGAVIRETHHSRVSTDNLMGWWSWTAYYTKITQGTALTNAQWLAEHLERLGYDYFHFDLGYGYSRGEYATPNASQFPRGMWDLTRHISRLGLKVGLWTAPFEAGERSWIYEHHKDWLVHNAHGDPISIGDAEEVKGERLFVLDTTHPDAQEYLRQTYRTLVREWGARYIKLDFMDNTAIEGYYHRPNTTALEAQRIGLEIIRKTVGEGVLLDKDGSPMLNPVGLVDEGRVSQDTGHTFLRSKGAEPGIAARYYMHRNFFITDPDAFTVSRQLLEERTIEAPATLNEAQVSIALAAVSGGMFEIGDDLPTLGKDPERLALVKNPDLLAMVKLGQVAVPLDLMTYTDQDEQPSVFLLREDERQSMLAVFNWTEQPRSHTFTLSDLNLTAGHSYTLRDAFAPDQPLAMTRETLRLDDQPAHSVKLVKIIDTLIPVAAPSIVFQVPTQAKIGEEITFSSIVSKDGVPALAYHWDFGDGVVADGAILTHAYTAAGNYTVRFTAEGLDGKSAEQTFSIAVSGSVILPPPRRYFETREPLGTGISGTQ